MSSTPTSTFAIQLKDETSGPAAQAAGALEALQAQIEGDTKALREMQAAMRRLNSGTVTNVGAFKELRDRIDAQKTAVASAQARYVELGGTFRQLPKPIERTTNRLEELARTSQALPGPLGAIGSKLGNLRGVTAGGAIAVGVVAIAVGLVALAAAATAATAAIVKYALGQSDARRSELLRLEGLTTLRNRFAATTGNAAQMQSAIDRVSSSVALSRGEVGGFAEQLHRAGLRGADLDAALAGMATTAAVQGTAQANRFARMAAGAARAGRSVRALADDVRGRLGGIAARQMLSLEVQSSKLQESFGQLFSGLRIEGFLQKMSELGALFSQSTSTGRALKLLVERLLQPMIDALEWLMPIARRFFQGMVIGALILEQGILRLRLWLKKTFGGSDILGGIDAMEVALWAGVLVIGGLAGAAAGAALAMGALAATALLIAAPFIIGAAAIAGVVYAGYKLVEWFQSMDWGQLGQSIIDGLVGSLRAGTTLVVQTVRGLADSAKDALTSALGIASPSRVFAELGEQIPRGMAVGIEAGAPVATGAVDEMIGAPAVAGGAAATMQVTIGDVHIHAKTDDPTSLAQAFREQLTSILEGVAIQMGAAV